MNIIERTRRFFSKIRDSWKTATTDFTNWRGRVFGGITNAELENNETIFSIITRLSSTISALPLNLYQNHKKQTDNDLADLINEPNENMSGYALFNELEVARDRDGNGYAMITRDRLMNPVSIVPVPASYVNPFINSDDGTLWYEVTASDFHAYIYHTEMIHVRHIHGPESLVGISPLKVLKNALDYDKAVSEFSLNEMDKMDTFIVKYDNFVDDESRKALTEQFQELIKNNGGVLFQQKGTEIERLDRNFKPGDVKDSDKITRTRIANAYNVPLTFLNDSTGNGVNSNEQLMIQFVQMTLTPIVKQYEAELNNKLLTKEQRKKGFYYKFNLNGLLRGDITARTAYYQAMIRNGIYSQNDIRLLEDMPPADDPMMDKHWISGDLYPTDMDPSQRKGVTKNEVLGNEETAKQ